MRNGQPYNDRRPISPESYDAGRCAEPLGPHLMLAVAQFNRREYFACHETLEELWNAEPTPIRTLYKGILQVGVGCLHLMRGNYRGAVLKLQTGADYLAPFSPRCMGVEVGRLIADAHRLREEIVECGPERLGDVDRALLPILQYTTPAA